jgi:hypothetical protein
VTTIVFAGPTIRHGEVLRLVPDAVCRPPAARGDVYRAVVAGARTIVIIDGYFDSVPSVWHKEILFALSRGTHVLGASSMGALRAAELAPFGMVGVGRIYEAFASGAVEDDDEVALLHAPAEFNYLPATVALVDIRATLDAALREGVIDRAVRDARILVAKRLHYRERTYDRLLATSPDESLAAWIREHKVDQKHEDALELLAALDRWCRVAAKKEPPRFVPTVYWQKLVDALGDERADTPAVDEIVKELGLRGPAIQELWRDAQLRTLALREAARRGTAPSLAVDQVRSRLYESLGFANPEQRSRWMKASGAATELDLDRMISDEAAVRSVLATLSQETRHALVESLRIMGMYGAIAARIRDKSEVLARTPPTEVPDEELLRWHFSRAGSEPSMDLGRYVVLSGYDDLSSFLIALRAEFAYAHARSRHSET